MRPAAPVKVLLFAAALAAAQLCSRAQSQQEPKPPLDQASWDLFQKVFGMVLRD